VGKLCSSFRGEAFGRFHCGTAELQVTAVVVVSSVIGAKSWVTLRVYKQDLDFWILMQLRC
jgi:hypothetical protein